MDQLFNRIALEADALLNDLQSSLHNQEEKLTTFAQQQRQVCSSFMFQLSVLARPLSCLNLLLYLLLYIQAHSRAIENARSISEITVNFFKTLDVHASNLTQIVEVAQTVNDHKLCEFEKKFEVITIAWYENAWIPIKSTLCYN